MGDVASFDMTQLQARARYKLLSSTVVPRPIALVVTIEESGGHNAAPYSFFNVLSEDPPLLALGLQLNEKREHKDTAANIHRTGEFVVNLVDDALAEAMNICAIDFPPGHSELEAAGLTLAESQKIRPQRVVESPVAFECRVEQVLSFSQRRDIVLGRVVYAHVRKHMIDPTSLDLTDDTYHPIGRLYGGLYSHQDHRFHMPRLKHGSEEAKRFTKNHRRSSGSRADE